MDIKEKLKSFIDKQKLNLKTTHNSQENVTLDEFEGRIAVFSQHQRRGSLLDEHKLTPEAEKAVIDSIEPEYFETDGADVGELELKKFPDITDIHVINGIRSRLRKQQAVVTRCVSNLILQKQGMCVKEIECIADLQQEICKAISLCVDGRSKLKQGRTQFTSASLGILANYSKRQRVADVIESLRTIRTLQMTDVQLQILLKAEDYPGAIQLLLECQKATATFKHFHCISELSSKLQETLELAEEQLDSAVSRVALNFNKSLYEKLFIAFGLFNKTQIMMDQLHMHLTSHIHNTAFNIILGYVELYNTNTSISNGNATSSPSYSKLQYSELCKCINQECFLACFLDLSKGMWNILRNYYNIIKWHKENKNYQNDTSSKNNESDTETHNDYIKQKLDHGLIRLWQDVQAKVRTYLLASDLCHFKFDDFLKVLDVINKLIEVGESFCESQSETLQDSIKKQSFSFFRSYHATRMEQLHMFLENEGWEICPVKFTFSINQLVEYRFLKEDFGATIHTPVSTPKRGVSNYKRNLFDIYEEGSPFDATNDDCVEEDIMADEVTENALSEEDSDEELSEELKRDFVDEQTGERPSNTLKRKRDLHKTPMVTNTTLTILRLFGKYIQMMRLLQPIAFDVLLCLSHLFEYYMYTVFTLFANRNTCDSNLSPRLRTTLQRIEETIILGSDVNLEQTGVDKVPPPSLGPHILNDLPESLYSLPVRVIAVESLAFLSQQLESLQSQIESLMPSSVTSSKNSFLQKFYTNTVMLTSEVRSHVYMHVASRVVDYDSLLTQMTCVRWDINDLMSQHNSYVDVLLRQLQILSIRIEELRRSHPIPHEALTNLWENVIRYTHRTLLEGFASTRKCTNEGRSLMQLDYQQFLMKLESLTPVRPLPDRHLVETYIKAYYLPDNSLEEWVSANQTVYSTRQLISLINCMTRVSKKTRQKITALLEDGNVLK